jgi:hypothetical protein
VRENQAASQRISATAAPAQWLQNSEQNGDDSLVLEELFKLDIAKTA